MSTPLEGGMRMGALFGLRKTSRRWKPLIAGVLMGLLAAGSSYGRPDTIPHSANNVVAQGRTQSLPTTERKLLLPNGRQLILAPNGSDLNLYDSARQQLIQQHRLPQTRLNASVTLLPSGRVLIWGGTDVQGRLQKGGFWFDVQSGALSVADDLTLLPRAGHTATVLTDGRVLIAGGRSEPNTAQLWDERDNRAVALANETAIDLASHSAQLQADGTVRLSGGMDHQNRASTRDMVFDIVSGRLAAQLPVGSNRIEVAPGLAASLPTQGADDVLPDARLSLRFTQRMRMPDLAASNVTLVGPGGAVPIRVTPAEDGRLLFVTPAQSLFPDSKYTLMVDEVHSALGKPIPLIAVDFKTAAFDSHGKRIIQTTAATVVSDASDSAVVNATKPNCAQTQRYFTPCSAKGELKDGIWTPGRNNTHNRWRIYGPSVEVKNNPRLSRIAALYNVTAVRGRVVRIDQQPVANVEVSVGQEVARTDANGWFTLYNVPAGYRELYVDGTTANHANEQYGQFVTGVQVKRGQLNELPYLMHLPRISQRDKVRIASPLQQDMIIGHPDIPGLELHIPKGTVIHDRKGRLVTELAIVPTPVNRAPFPVMENHPMAFTVEPGAAQIRGLSPKANNGIRIYYPNYDQYASGTQANFWIYDPRDGWRIYGNGTVSADGKHIVPERGVALHQTMGGMYSVPGTNGPTEPGLPPDNSGTCGCTGGAATAGDPIDLKTGEFTHAETDIGISDIVPITISRNYRPHDLQRREFGIGTSWNWGYTLNRPDTTTYDIIDLVLPTGSSVRFNRISGNGNQGEWRQAGSNTKFTGAILKTVYDSDPTQPWGRGFLLTLRDGSRMQFSSYNDIRVRWIEDRHGNRTSLTYSAGLVTKIVSPSGRTLSIDYDSSNRIQTITDQNNRVWTYIYNANGLLQDVVYPDTTAKHYAYQTRLESGTLAYHRIESITDQKNQQILLNEFEVVNGIATGRVIKQTQADGGTIQINYAHADNGVTGTLVTEPDGSQRRIVFAATGFYPQSETLAYGTPLAQTYLYERNAYGQLTATVDPLGRRTETLYNTDGLVARVTALASTAQSRAVEMTYNGDGDLATVTDPLNRTTMFDYTARCLASVTDPLNRSATFACNAAGQLTRITDPLNRTTVMAYDGYDLASVTDPLGRVVRFRYDQLGRLIATEDGRGNIVRREYDTLGRLKKAIDAKGQAVEYGYDANSNLAAVLLPNGNGVTYTFDARNRPLTRVDALSQTETWIYDAADRVKTYRDRNNQLTQFDYDALGRLQLTTHPDGSTLTATFDAGNRLRTLVDTAGVGTLGWDYNAFDQVIAATGPQGTVSYDYDGVGRRMEMTVASQPTVTYSYDNGDRLQLITQGSELVDFDYDTADRLTQLTLPNGVKTGYAYNLTDQVTGIAWLKADDSPIGDLGYGYDSIGRLTAQTGSYASQTLPAASSGANAFDDNNRQTQYNGQTLSYDANGNLTGDGTRTYVWNSRNQLTQIQQGGNTLASYQYDALGRRISKTEAGTTTGYLYDGADAVQETQGATINPLLTGLGIDQRYARNDSGGRTYFLTDHLGSTRALTDATGNVVNRYDYTAYGQTSQTGSGFSNPYQYTGRERDVTGLYYYRARYYQPDMGRFISEDSYGFAAGDNNFYAYALGNPISYNDPSGHLVWFAAIPIIWGGIEIALSVYDAYDTAKTLMNPCASNGQKVTAVGLWAAGIVLPGGGYSKIDDVVDVSRAIKPNRIYSARELWRRAEDTGPNHNFPDTFDQHIFDNGTRTMTENFWRTTKPGLSNDAVMYTLPGNVNGVEGIYEIGVRPSNSGNTEVITHRFFRPTR